MHTFLVVVLDCTVKVQPVSIFLYIIINSWDLLLHFYKKKNKQIKKNDIERESVISFFFLSFFCWTVGWMWDEYRIRNLQFEHVNFPCRLFCSGCEVSQSYYSSRVCHYWNLSNKLTSKVLHSEKAIEARF